MAALSFLSLYRTNRLSNKYNHVLGWGFIRGRGLLAICSSRVGAYSRWANSRIYGIKKPHLFLWEVHQSAIHTSQSTILAKSPWDTSKKLWKTIAFSAFHSLRLLRTPVPPKTMLVCSWDIWCYCARKNFSVTACTSLKNQHCLGGGGGRMFRPD